MGYIIVTVLIARAVELWDRGLLFQTIFWVVVSGYPLLLSVTVTAKDRGYFRKAAKSVFETGVIFLFFINIVTFSLVWEIILQIALVVLTGTLQIENKDDQLRQICPVLTVLLDGVIFLLTIFTVIHLYQQRNNIESDRVGLSFLLNIWLPLATIGFLVPLAYIVEYKVAFRWMTLRRPEGPSGLRDKVALIVGLNIH